MPETARILDQLRRAFDGDAWSGPSLVATLQGVTAAQARQRPLPAAHSIWEIVLHVTAWVRMVQQRLAENRLVEMLDADNWPALPESTDEAAWQRAQQDLYAAHVALLTTAARFHEADLTQELGATPDQPQGAGVTNYVLLHGVAQHNLYHAGQGALLKKAFV
ncbi:DinB family protein [Hymenobacter koreensis]|uniref:DinB-like domain-containing protein n=1 Tax=Hymenobacter koreensis TaxID=1084523 RepID=A0ABP8IWD0_9BACT